MSEGEPGTYADVGGADHHEPTPGAPDDQEMPLADHIQEMVHRLGIVVLAMAACAIVAILVADRLINFLWFSILPGVAQQCPPPTADAASSAACPRVYHPLALMLARLKVATLVGFVVALPVFVYQTYRFMRPGLYPAERKYYLAAVPTSVVLAGIGVAFAFFAVLPAIFTYFLYYSQSAATIAFGLTETFNLIVMMLGLFAFIFQIPLFIMLAIMMGITTRRWMEARRVYFWGGFLTIALLFSPDPTGMAPFIVAITMGALFEGTLALLRWTGSGGFLPTYEGVLALRPAVYLLVGFGAYLASPAPIPDGYYDQLPSLLLAALDAVGLLGATPFVVGGAVLLSYEAVVYLLGRYRRLRARRALQRIRLPVWLAAGVAGYLASPTPLFVETARDWAVPTMEVAVVAVGVVAAYEVGLAVWQWRRTRGGA
jgi:sec-independent protein translocase protein TatC